MSDMELLHQDDLLAAIRKEIDDGGYFCEEKNCNCFQQILEKLQYSILSHRWGGDEFTFNHLMMLKGPLKGNKPSETPGVRSLTQIIGKLMGGANPLQGTMLDKLNKLKDQPSVEKLLEFRKASIERKCEYGWLDTVCINKTSSAELDESLRSMYAWYRESYVCIVHLGETDHCIQMEKEPWFTRGWTLQELLAPTRVAFYARRWLKITTYDNDKLEDMKRLGIGKGNSANEEANEDDDEEEEEEVKEEKRKEAKLVWPLISEVTGIPLEDLLNFKPGPHDIGKRLGWASKRTTTRIEDMAYCLIGVFNVDLPIAYGERDRAFHRLQAELIQNSDDKSVFTWQDKSSELNSMLAANAQCFSKVFPPMIDLLPLANSDTLVSMTNIGLRMPALIFKMGVDGVPKVPKIPEAAYMAVIGKLSGSGDHVVVLLAKTEVPRQYRRVGLLQTKIIESRLSKTAEVIYVK
jgi:hypothetical protein